MYQTNPLIAMASDSGLPDSTAFGRPWPLLGNLVVLAACRPNTAL